MARKKTLYERTLNTEMHSRFVALAEDLGHPLSDNEVIEEASYQLEDLPYKGLFDDDPALYRKIRRQLNALLK